MRHGEVLRFRGPAGAEFVVEVGVTFDLRTIRARVDSGEWTSLEDKPAPAAPRKRAARKTAAKKTAAADTPEGDNHGG